jgi:cysteine synthase
VKIAKNITDLIGNTPLLKLNSIERKFKLDASIIAKLESFNPARSVKDRIGFALIDLAEHLNWIDKNTVIIEPTSGNTGIALAFVAASKGYHLILVMPDSMSIERRNILRAFGAEIVLSPGYEGMGGAIRKAIEIKNSHPKAYIPNQFNNYANPAYHRKTTAQEIWNDTDGQIDIFIAGVGTGGTITGVGEVLKERNPKIKVVAVEPSDSAVLSGGKPGPHKIQGIGAGFIPGILNVKIYDEIFRVKNEEAFEISRQLARTEGLIAGVSSGASVYAAIQIARRPENKGKNIVVILPDTGERYLSTPLFQIDKNTGSTGTISEDDSVF